MVLLSRDVCTLTQSKGIKCEQEREVAVEAGRSTTSQPTSVHISRAVIGSSPWSRRQPWGLDSGWKMSSDWSIVNNAGIPSKGFCAEVEMLDMV